MSKVKIKCMECGKPTKFDILSTIAICKKCLKKNGEVYSPKRLDDDFWTS